MIDIEVVRSLSNEFIKDKELFIVDINISETNVINILLDSMENVTIGDCISLSKYVENSLDREKNDFELMVSSAGVGQPLKLQKQLIKNIDRLVEVIDEAGIKHSGVLKEAADDSFGVEITRKIKLEGKKRKELVTTIESFKLSEIKSVVVIPEIGRKKKK